MIQTHWFKKKKVQIMQKSTKASKSLDFPLSLSVVFNLGCMLELLGGAFVVVLGRTFLKSCWLGPDSDLIGLGRDRGFNIFLVLFFMALKQAFIL